MPLPALIAGTEPLAQDASADLRHLLWSQYVAPPTLTVHSWSGAFSAADQSDNLERTLMNSNATAESALDDFDLDIRIIESGDTVETLINLTDDGCGSTCASPCATNVA